MDVVTFALVEASGADGGEEFRDRAVEKNLGRHGGFEVKLYFGAVALVGSDAVAGVVEGETLLVVAFHAGEEVVVGNGEAGTPAGGEEVVHRNPAAGLQREAEGFRGVAEVFGEELAEFGE